MFSSRSNRPSRVTDETNRLEKERLEIQRKKQALEKQERELDLQKRKKAARKPVILQADATMRMAAPLRHAGGERVQKRLPKKEARSAQIQFAILCLVFFVLVALLWRAIPS
jgi:hypothetical protein